MGVTREIDNVVQLVASSRHSKCESLGFINQLLDTWGCEDSEREARLLLAHVMGDTSGRVPELPDEIGPLRVKQTRLLQELLAFRHTGVPIQCLLGYTYSHDCFLRLTPDVLVPSLEVDIVIDTVTAILSRTPSHNARVLDLCTGCGVIAIVLAKQFPRSHFVATDISENVLSVASANATLNGVYNILFTRSDMFSTLQTSNSEPFDLIVSNPPYFPTNDVRLQPLPLKKHLPALAIDGGRDGLAFFRTLTHEAHCHIRKGGHAVFLHAMGQHDIVRHLFIAARRYEVVECRCDRFGDKRIIVLRRLT